jgi:hypothetical protein
MNKKEAVVMTAATAASKRIKGLIKQIKSAEKCGAWRVFHVEYDLFYGA